MRYAHKYASGWYIVCMYFIVIQVSLYLPTHTPCFQRRKNKACGRIISPAVVLTVSVQAHTVTQTEDRRGCEEGGELRREQERERWFAGLKEVVEEVEGRKGCCRCC